MNIVLIKAIFFSCVYYRQILTRWVWPGKVLISGWIMQSCDQKLFLLQSTSFFGVYNYFYFFCFLFSCDWWWFFAMCYTISVHLGCFRFYLPIFWSQYSCFSTSLFLHETVPHIVRASNIPKFPFHSFTIHVCTENDLYCSVWLCYCSLYLACLARNCGLACVLASLWKGSDSSMNTFLSVPSSTSGTPATALYPLFRSTKDVIPDATFLEHDITLPLTDRLLQSSSSIYFTENQ